MYMATRLTSAHQCLAGNLYSTVQLEMLLHVFDNKEAERRRRSSRHGWFTEKLAAPS